MGRHAGSAFGDQRGQRKKRLTARREFLIELSFELGIPEEELAQRLSERSFSLYRAYAGKWRLPTRRLQVMLAQVCEVLAKVNGNKDVSIPDFLLDPEEDEEDGPPMTPEQNIAAQKQIFGFSPRRKE